MLVTIYILFTFLTDLDVDKLMEDASSRWFRPNEVYAILSNYTLFKIQPQPIDNPASILLVLCLARNAF